MEPWYVHNITCRFIRNYCKVVICIFHYTTLFPTKGSSVSGRSQRRRLDLLLRQRGAQRYSSTRQPGCSAQLPLTPLLLRLFLFQFSSCCHSIPVFPLPFVAPTMADTRNISKDEEKNRDQDPIEVVTVTEPSPNTADVEPSGTSDESDPEPSTARLVLVLFGLWVSICCPALLVAAIYFRF